MVKKWDKGDFVTWNSSGGRARGRIEDTATEGTIRVPDSTFTLNATEDDPVALIRVFRPTAQGLAATDITVGHRFSALTAMPESDMEMTKSANADEIVLGFLREFAGSQMTPEIWGIVEKEVAQFGVRNLTGSSREIVSGLVAKHGGKDGTHDESDHGNWANRGGGGSKKPKGGKKRTDAQITNDFLEAIAGGISGGGSGKGGSKKPKGGKKRSSSQDDWNTLLEILPVNFGGGGKKPKK
jgi:hypothetical protein